MKNLILSFVFLFAINTILEAQIKVISSGNASIGDYEPSTSYDLKTGTARFYDNVQLYRVGISVAPESGYSLKISGNMKFDNGNYYGILVGTGDMYEKAIYPTSNNRCHVGKSDQAFKYMYSYHFINPSDKRLKENIRDIDNALDIVTQLKGVEYDMKKEFFSDETAKKIPGMEEKIEKERKDHYGFLAQDVKEIYPYAVSYDDSTDIYGIDYTKFVPILVEAIKEQQSEIEVLKEQLGEKAISEFKSDDNIEVNSSMTALLEQNVPNPFTENTIIKFYIPSEASEANIYIYDLQGKQIQNESLNQRESGELIISGSTLSPGMYHYTLIIDNEVVDTKTMILTD